jgi:hypothetical protein
LAQNLNEILEKIYSFLPSVYHKDVLICASHKDILQFLIKIGYVKSVESAKSYLNGLPEESNSDITNEYFSLFKGKKHRSYTILGLACHATILLNRAALQNESERCIILTILHEIGHLTSKNKIYHTEEYADKFAVSWLKKMIISGLIR